MCRSQEGPEYGRPLPTLGQPSIFWPAIALAGNRAPHWCHGRSLSAIVAVGALALARAQHHTNFSHLHLCEQHNSQEMLDRHSLTHFCPHEAVLEYSQEQGFDGMAVLLLDPFTQRPRERERSPRATP